MKKLTKEAGRVIAYWLGRSPKDGENIVRVANSHNELIAVIGNLLYNRCPLSEEQARRALAKEEGLSLHDYDVKRARA